MKLPSAAITLALILPASQHAQPVSPSNAVIRSEVRSVLVDAIVTRKNGDYVGDLATREFHVWQDGKEQTITSLSLEKTSTEPHFLVLFFDNTRLTALDQVLARQAVARFIDTNSAAPHRLMAVVSFGGTLRIAQNFTDNAGRLKDALNRMDGASNVTTPSAFERTGDRAASSAANAADNFASRNMVQSLAGLAKNLGALPGRKTVVLLTGGVASSAEAKSQAAIAIEAASRSGVAIYPVNVKPASIDIAQAPDPVSARGGGGAMGRSRPQPRGDDDSPPAIGPSVSAFPSTDPVLNELATGTGGLFIRDSRQLLEGLQRIGEEQTEYYLLSYTPPEAKDGSCHSLKVRVDRKGATVRARNSYCATTAPDLVTAVSSGPSKEAVNDLENRANGTEPGNLKASLQLPYTYLAPDVARVHLAMEIAPAGLTFTPQKGKFHTEINLFATATAPDGTLAARFNDTLRLDFDTQAELDKQKIASIHYENEFKIAPGEYAFTLSFGQGTNFGKLEAPLAVERWNGTDFTLSRLVLSREARAAADTGLVASLFEGRTPLVAEGVEFIPSGSNQFTRSDNGSFYLEIYGPNPAAATVRVRVLNRATGAPQWDSGWTTLPPPAPPSPAKPFFSAASSLRLSSMPPASYRLQVTGKDPSGKQITRTVDFDLK